MLMLINDNRSEPIKMTGVEMLLRFVLLRMFKENYKKMIRMIYTNEVQRIVKNGIQRW